MDGFFPGWKFPGLDSSQNSLAALPGQFCGIRNTEQDNFGPLQFKGLILDFALNFKELARLS